MDKSRLNILFLDIDGVLNTPFDDEKTPGGDTGISAKKLKALGSLIAKFDLEIVLTSSWRQDIIEESKDGIYLTEQLAKIGTAVYDVTKYMSPSERAVEILTWIKEHYNEINDLVILDDQDFDFNKYANLKRHLVKCNVHNGKDKFGGLLDCSCASEEPTEFTHNIVDFLESLRK